MFFPDPTREIHLTLNVVFAGFGITAPEFGYDDYAGLDVRGKAVLVFDFHPGYHEPSDTFDRLDFEKLSRAVALTINAARALGQRRAPAAVRAGSSGGGAVDDVSARGASAPAEARAR